jgi:hypothetical protein
LLRYRAPEPPPGNLGCGRGLFLYSLIQMSDASDLKKSYEPLVAH